MSITYNSLTLTPPRITSARFTALLKTKNSPAVPEAVKVYDVLVLEGVDPSFALAQFRVESQYGTSGYAKITHSWGNMLYDSHLTILASGKYSPGNGYTYATYDNYVDAILDYCRYIHWYKDNYGFDTIYEATARWIGKAQGSSGHISYINIIIDDMIRYEFPAGGYESGDKMIYAGPSLNRDNGTLNLKYQVVKGLVLYRGTDGSVLKTYAGLPGNAWWVGYVNGGKTWGALVIGTSSADPDATIVYIKNPDPRRIVTARNGEEA
jgi:hypothetical protein